MSATHRHLASRGQKSYQHTPLNLEQLEARMLMTINTAEEAIGLINLLGSAYDSAEVQSAAPDVQVPILASRSRLPRLRLPRRPQPSPKPNLHPSRT